VSLVLSALTATGSVIGGGTAASTAAGAPTVSTKVDLAASGRAGRVLWSGNFERGGVPHGANGRSCGTGKADGGDSRADQYRSIEEMGNTACTNRVSFSRERTRTSDSHRALKVVMGPRQQRELAKSKFGWRPNARGSVNQWYGFSIYYSSDWNQMGGLLREISGSDWVNPVGWRTQGANGSLNFSGDMNMSNANGRSYKKFSSPHMILRRNTVRNNEHFYKDGKGLDKMDLGPIVTNKWMDFVCHIRWSTTRHNALRECWRDGHYRGAKTSRNAVDTRVHHLRVGVYQETSIRHTRTMYVDNVRIGTSYRAVDPSRTR
jgi:hypothetical protein